MPIYIYQHPESEKYIEVFQGMNEDHVYMDKEGTEWKRIFTTPNMGIDLDNDPFNQNKFIEKTQNGGTMGDLWDRSSEMSAKRAEKSGGIDPYKKDYFKKYSKDRGGAKHLDDLNS